MKYENIKKVFPFIVIVVLVFIYWWRLVFTGMTVFWEIMFRFSHPFITFYSQAIKNIELPLWNPHILCGTPYMAMLQFQVFYPFNLLFAIFQFPAALNLYIVIHTALAGIFTYILMRYNKLDTKESMLGSIIFMFNGFFVFHIEFICTIATYVWLPLIFYFFQKSLHELRLKYFILTAVSLSLQFFAGFPQFCYFTVLILLFYLILSWAVKKTKVSVSAIYTLVMLILFIMLVSVQLLPTLELAGLSERNFGISYDQVTAYSLFPRELLVYLFVPAWNIIFKKTLHDVQTTGFYCGALAFVLVLLSLRNKENKHFIAYCFGLALAGLMLSLGVNLPGYKLFSDYFPGMKFFRFPVQNIYLSVFGIIFLGSYGLRTIKNETLKTGIIVFYN